MWRANGEPFDLFLHANHFRTSTFIAHSDACCNRLTCDGATKFASVAGFGVRGPFGPRGGISSGPRPGSSSGRGDSPGSRIGGVISGCGLPGGISGGGSLGVPGVAGGISGGSIGIVHHRQFVARRTTTFPMRRCSALRERSNRPISACDKRPRYCGRRDRARTRHSTWDDNARECRVVRCHARRPRSPPCRTHPPWRGPLQE
jgi:hypothetical protein